MVDPVGVGGTGRVSARKARLLGLTLTPIFLFILALGAGPGRGAMPPIPPAEPVLACNLEAQYLAIGLAHCSHYHRKVSSLAWEGGSARLAVTLCLVLGLGFTGSGRIIDMSV